MMWLWHHHSIFLLIGVSLFVGTVLTALFFSPSFMECVHFLVDAAACSEPADTKFNGMLNPTSALLLGGGKYRVTSFSSSSEAAKIKKDIVDGCKKDNDPLPDNTRKSWHVSCELTIAVASLGILIFVIITMVSRMFLYCCFESVMLSLPSSHVPHIFFYTRLPVSVTKLSSIYCWQSLKPEYDISNICFILREPPFHCSLDCVDHGRVEPDWVPVGCCHHQAYHVCSPRCSVSAVEKLQY